MLNKGLSVQINAINNNLLYFKAIEGAYLSDITSETEFISYLETELAKIPNRTRFTLVPTYEAGAVFRVDGLKYTDSYIEAETRSYDKDYNYLNSCYRKVDGAWSYERLVTNNDLVKGDFWVNLSVGVNQITDYSGNVTSLVESGTVPNNDNILLVPIIAHTSNNFTWSYHFDNGSLYINTNYAQRLRFGWTSFI